MLTVTFYIFNKPSPLKMQFCHAQWGNYILNPPPQKKKFMVHALFKNQVRMKILHLTSLKINIKKQLFVSRYCIKFAHLKYEESVHEICTYWCLMPTCAM